MPKVKIFYGGFSFLEMMLASALSLIILASLFQVYLSCKETYRKNTILSETQNDIRFVSEVLTGNIRMAGYSGCGKMQVIKAERHYTTHGPMPFDLKWESNIFGFSSADAPSYLRDKIAPDTDGIEILRADADTTKLAGDVKTPASKIKVVQNPATVNDKILLLSDCDFADIFQADNAYGRAINLQGKSKIRHGYLQKDSEVSRVAELTYFISDSGRLDQQGKPVYGLYVITNRGNKEELVSNLNNMKIAYGIGKSGKGGIRYYNASRISTHKLWRSVRSVAISLNFACGSEARKKIQFYVDLRN